MWRKASPRRQIGKCRYCRESLYNTGPISKLVKMAHVACAVHARR